MPPGDRATPPGINHGRFRDETALTQPYPAPRLLEPIAANPMAATTARAKRVNSLAREGSSVDADAIH